MRDANDFVRDKALITLSARYFVKDAGFDELPNIRRCGGRRNSAKENRCMSETHRRTFE